MVKDIKVDKVEIQTIAKLPCQNCGKLVIVHIPFYGCIFCSECMKDESYETADAPEFKRKFDWNEMRIGDKYE